MPTKREKTSPSRSYWNFCPWMEDVCDLDRSTKVNKGQEDSNVWIQQQMIQFWSISLVLLLGREDGDWGEVVVYWENRRGEGSCEHLETPKPNLCGDLYYVHMTTIMSVLIRQTSLTSAEFGFIRTFQSRSDYRSLKIFWFFRLMQNSKGAIVGFQLNSACKKSSKNRSD